MKLKLDENLGLRAAALLRTAGHDVATVPEEELCSATDELVLEVSATERRCLVTMDLDFANPLRFKPSAHAGIAVLRLPAQLARTDLDDVIATLVAGLSQLPIEGKLWVVQGNRIREYTPEE